MDKTTDKKKKSAKQRLGSIASMFGGLLGDAVDSSKGMKKDSKTNTRRKTSRQQMLDDL